MATRKFIHLNGEHYPLDTIRKLILTEDYVVLYRKGELPPVKYRFINLHDFNIGLKEVELGK